jgi:hypothetical protein
MCSGGSEGWEFGRGKNQSVTRFVLPTLSLNGGAIRVGHAGHLHEEAARKRGPL